MLVLILLAVLTATSALPSQHEAKATCGYQSCPAVKPGMLNVHLVPHTHDDVGWLKTVDQYFYGHKNNIQKAGVQYIIDSVITELQKDPARRFIYVETAFFWQWWLEQDEAMRADVRALVNSGQLEFISGAWSMNDEAVTHYQSIVDQFTWGLRKLNETFGECGRPRIGWQIDPFGHSREMASMLAHFGFDGLFFARLDYQDKDAREDSKTMEMIWEGSPNQGSSSDLFTSILYYFYMAPPFFCFDIECNDEPLIDNPRSPDYNIPARTSEFIARIREQAALYNSNNIMFTMGGDFNYQQADTWYKNMDKLIKYINADQANNNINLLYSTPSCYVKAVNEAGITLTRKQDDFFPYSSDPHAFWTGYYTSRPTQKYFERKGNQFLQVCKQLHVLAGVSDSKWESLDSLREVMGVMQHHDAITGTEKQHVADDYALRLSQAFDDCRDSTQTALNKLLAKQGDAAAVPLTPCLMSNVSQCEVSENNDVFVVTLYNPLAHENTQYPRLPVVEAANTYQILDPAGVEVMFDMVPIPASVLEVPGRESSATHELVFKAGALPPLGFKSYYVHKVAAQQSPALKPSPGKFNIGSDRGARVELDPSSGLLKSLRVGERAIEVTQDFLYYTAAVGNNEVFENRSSGAYIFRPVKDDADPVSAEPPTVITFEGNVVHEVHQVFSDWVSQVIRTYPDEDYTEFEWLVGPIPTDNTVGKEIITRFSTDWLTTAGKFYTDSNGRERLERVRDSRPTWTVDLQEKVAGNYYPITTAISLRSDTEEFSVLTDRAQGASSLHDGELEIMVHRRLHHDDAFGVGEALNEIQFEKGMVARGRHILSLGSLSESPSGVARQRQLSMQHMVLPAWVVLSPTSLTWQQWAAKYNTQWSGLKASLPENAHLTTLEPWSNGEILLRLEHFLERSDDPALGQDVSLELAGIFTDLDFGVVKETTLGGNQWIEASSRLNWGSSETSSPPRDDRELVQLQPMQMRTFVLRANSRAPVTSSTLLALLGALLAALLAQ